MTYNVCHARSMDNLLFCTPVLLLAVELTFE